MMTITAYLQNILATEGFDAYCALEDELYELHEQDADEWIATGEYGARLATWAEAHGVDLEAPAIEGSDITALQQWLWDYEG